MDEVKTAAPEQGSEGLRVLGFFLGVAGMLAYTGGVQCAWRVTTQAEIVGSLHVWQVGALVSSVGCMLFCVAVALIWQLSLRRLMLLVVIAGVLLGAVAQICKNTERNWRDKHLTTEEEDVPLVPSGTTVQPAAPLNGNSNP